MRTKKTLWLGVLFMAIFCGFTANAQQRITVSELLQMQKQANPYLGLPLLNKVLQTVQVQILMVIIPLDVASDAVLTFLPWVMQHRTFL